MSKAPWLLGSLGTVSMDITLFLQVMSSYTGLEYDQLDARTFSMENHLTWLALLQSRYFAYRLASKSAMEPNERTPLLA